MPPFLSDLGLAASAQPSVPTTSRLCSRCHELFPRAHFSKTQLKRQQRAACRTCVDKLVTETAPNAGDSAIAAARAELAALQDQGLDLLTAFQEIDPSKMAPQAYRDRYRTLVWLMQTLAQKEQMLADRVGRCESDYQSSSGSNQDWDDQDAVDAQAEADRMDLEMYGYLRG
jgi:hypothetical protein